MQKNVIDSVHERKPYTLRRKTFTKEIEEFLKVLVEQMADEKGFIVRMFECGEADHIHCFVTAPSPLYQRVRASNLMFYRGRSPEFYQHVLKHTIESARQGKTFGEWNDYGRLLDY